MPSSTFTSMVRAILSNFDHVSVQRLHKLAFLIEWKHYDETGERLTDAQYQRKPEGCYSEDLQTVIEQMDGIYQKQVSVGSNLINTLIVEADLEEECDSNTNLSHIIDTVVSSYGQVAPKEIDEQLKKISAYDDAGRNDIIVFD